MCDPAHIFVVVHESFMKSPESKIFFNRYFRGGCSGHYIPIFKSICSGCGVIDLIRHDQLQFPPIWQVSEVTKLFGRFQLIFVIKLRVLFVFDEY